MQRKGRVLNELSYKTGREEERLTWSAGAPLFLLLFFSVFLFFFFVYYPPLCYCFESGKAPLSVFDRGLLCSPSPVRSPLFALPVSFSVKPPVLGLFLVSSPLFRSSPLRVRPVSSSPLCVFPVLCPPVFFWFFPRLWFFPLVFFCSFLCSPLRGLFSGFYSQRMPRIRASWGRKIAAGRRGP